MGLYQPIWQHYQLLRTHLYRGITAYRTIGSPIPAIRRRRGGAGQCGRRWDARTKSIALSLPAKR